MQQRKAADNQADNSRAKECDKGRCKKAEMGRMKIERVLRVLADLGRVSDFYFARRRIFIEMAIQ